MSTVTRSLALMVRLYPAFSNAVATSFRISLGSVASEASNAVVTTAFLLASSSACFSKGSAGFSCSVGRTVCSGSRPKAAASSTAASGGAGGGGNSGVGEPHPGGTAGQNGTANTGGGGGASNNNTGGNGGSGIVVVRGPSAVAFAGSPCCAFTGSTHPGGDKIAKFTASGTLTVSLA